MEGGIDKKVNHCSQEGQLSKWVLPNNWSISELDHLCASSCLLVIVLRVVNQCSQEGLCTANSPKISPTPTEYEIQAGVGEGSQCQCQPLKPPPTQPPTVPNGLFGCTICGWCRAVKTGWWTECTSFLPSPLTIVKTMDDESFWQEGWSKNS